MCAVVYDKMDSNANDILEFSEHYFKIWVENSVITIICK